MDYLLLVGGLALLFFGGEMLVRGAVALARNFGVSPLVIGLTIVGFGTSTPELLVSIQAALRGQPDIAVGNVVGSNIANILLILGVAALVSPLKCKPSLVFRDGSFMIAASVALLFLGWIGIVGRATGAALVCGLIGYIVFSFWMDRQKEGETLHELEAGAVAVKSIPVWMGALFFALGLGGVLWGASLLIDGAVSIAQSYGVPERVIGLTLVAVGTSLPELATSVIASLRGQSDVAVGNVIGSNIFNILGILGAASIVHPIPIHAAMAGFDIPVMLAVAALAQPFLISGWRISRIEGGLFLLVYGAYVWWIL